MKITLKLFATLTDYLPDGAKGNMIDLDIDASDRVGSVIDRLRMPEKLVHLVLVNGSYVAPGDRATLTLKDGDQLAIWPPVAGG